MNSLVGSKHRVIPLGLLALGAAAAGYGLRWAPGRTWPNLLLDGFYISSLGVSALFFLATQRLTNARWSANLRRIPEALMMVLPLASVLLLLLFFGRETLFPWARPALFGSVPAIAGKVHYLNAPWVFARMIAVLAVWSAFALLARGTSLQQDDEPARSLDLHQRMTNRAVLFVPIFALTFTVAAFDWLISLQPEWFSTMFAIYVFAGTFVQGIAAVALAVALLRQFGPLRDVVSEHQLHDLGKMLFAFSTFWAYIWVCQYLLIWYGNIPEEVTHYVARTNGPWLFLFALNFVLNWVAPFCVLLPVRAKCSTRTIIGVSILLLLGHWLDLYLLIMPSFSQTPWLGISELLIAGGYAALVYLVFRQQLASASLVPRNDPVLAYEQLHAVQLQQPDPS